MTHLELLSPAKNKECGISAIDHGADAVYIGAPRFGARASAGNSIEDIAELCSYAHLYDAKVYVTVNTIIYDDELQDTITLCQQLKDIGVDAILLQDMGLLTALRHAVPGLRIHASTQTDNRTAEKVAWLASMGIKRVVLARELSISEIDDIHRAVPDVELEAFVHGALCVSYSGQCYASHHCFGRSANRGECAQFCRMPFSLIDADGNTLEEGIHLLSLRDMAQIDNLERLADASAMSFKIEGRLKDADYVKNVTAAYSERLNDICRKHPDRYCRASMGRCTYTFAPDIRKSFNRGFTTYFADGRQRGLVSFDTPKAIGEPVGKVKEMRGNSFNVASTAAFSNGDGLCFFNRDRQLIGFRVNRAEGNRLFPLQMPRELKPGTMLYRNLDHAFQSLLAKPSAERKIDVTMSLHITADAITLTMTDEHGNAATASVACDIQTAQKPQDENIHRQLTKLGGTPYLCTSLSVDSDIDQPFIPSSLLAQLRRETVEALSGRGTTHDDGDAITPPQSEKAPDYDIPYLYNAANTEARRFYDSIGIHADSYERPAGDDSHARTPILMQCRYCLRNELGYCTKTGRKAPWREPLSIRLDDGKTFQLHFNCKKCEMEVR